MIPGNKSDVAGNVGWIKGKIQNESVILRLLLWRMIPLGPPEKSTGCLSELSTWGCTDSIDPLACISHWSSTTLLKLFPATNLAWEETWGRSQRRHRQLGCTLELSTPAVARARGWTSAMSAAAVSPTPVVHTCWSLSESPGELTKNTEAQIHRREIGRVPLYSYQVPWVILIHWCLDTTYGTL